MFLLELNLNPIEIFVLLLGVAVFGIAVHFFIVYRRSLKKALQKKIDQPIHIHYEEKPPVKKRSDEVLFRKAKPQPEPKAPVYREERPVYREELRREKPVPEEPRQESVHSLKNIINQQQKMLSSLLEKAESLQNSQLLKENEDMGYRISELEKELEEKEEEAKEYRQQALAAQKMAERIEEVYREFDALQERMMELEKQASHANSLTLELEDIRDSYESIRKDLVRKQTRLEETVAENHRLHQQLGEVEDKLAEANLQRQQLHKKIQFLQDINNDMQNMSETNKKLQTEMRRIGELESMLNMIAEERDHLLRKQFGK